MDQHSGIDPADQWVFDPATGSYQMRLDGGGAPAPHYEPAPAPHYEPAPAPAPAPADIPPRPEGRAAARGRRRAEQRRSPRGRIPVWLGCTAALAIIGGGVGGYLLYGHRTPSCTSASTATASPDPSPTVSRTADAAAATDALRGPMAAPINVRVNIFDGTGRFGSSQAVLSWLQNSNGVTRSTNAGPASHPVATTTLDYAPNQADQARRLAKMMDLPASALKEGTTMAAFRQPMTLTLGRDFTAPGQPFATPTPTTAPTPAKAASSPHC
ncbi:LytR C-terminal domain-containing protein [Streptomyces sp. RB6PN25]|uniref:LytR C-terminal domain-containing protein n=1 Tax=Streptomyces humicola TaxID=2953240 RepID=A0ABT1Q527_9ACTN|nr:LytR C-terminal domain-containing protein [Streptomyces humicola]MCQ4085032.1 LytR C-terminal domain-containing protein [Streptomyces humicola]